VHLCSANCLRRFSCASIILLSSESGTLNSRPQSEQTPTAGTGPSHFVTRRLRAIAIVYGRLDWVVRPTACVPVIARGCSGRYVVTAAGFHLIGKETERGWERNDDVSTLICLR
jgi:hypothetical protein